MLTHDQRKALTGVVARRLPANTTIPFVEPLVGPAIAQNLPSGTVWQIAEWIVDSTLAEATPDLFVSLVTRVDDDRNRMASLAELADALRADPGRWRSSRAQAAIDWSPQGDPLQVLDGRPFLDRAAFRNLIPRLGAPDTPACTLVKGDDGQGKSYLHEYCRKLAKHWAGAQPGMLRVGVSECRASGVSSLNPELPALELSSGLGLNLRRAPRRHEDPHRYARNLATWIAAETPAGPLPALAILDGYGEPALPRPVRTFIEELIRWVQSDEEVKSRLRVILLDYDSGRLEEQGLDFQLLVLEHVGDDEIGDWFRKRFPGQADFRYEEAIEEIRSQVPDNGPLRMQHICVFVQALAAGFEAV